MGRTGKGGGVSWWPFSKRRDMVSVHEQEEALIAATQDAREHLPEFWNRWEKADDRSLFMVKAGLEGPDGAREHIWLNDLSREPLEGALCNEPHGLGGLRARDRVRFLESQISDWAYVTERGAHGHFTTRALLPFMNKNVRRDVESTLATTAIETKD